MYTHVYSHEHIVLLPKLAYLQIANLPETAHLLISDREFSLRLLIVLRKLF